MAVAFCVTFVSLLSHVLAGGAVPGVLNIALPLSLSLLVCTGLSGRHFTLLRLAIMVAISQMLFHLMFSMGSDHASMAQPRPGDFGAHGMNMILELPRDSALPMPGHGDASMIIAHVIAGIATVLFVHRGDELMTSLAGLMALCRWTRFWVLLAYSHQPPAPLTAPPGWEEPRACTLAVYSTSVIRRGPPLVATAQNTAH